MPCFKLLDGRFMIFLKVLNRPRIDLTEFTEGRIAGKSLKGYAGVKAGWAVFE